MSCRDESSHKSVGVAAEDNRHPVVDGREKGVGRGGDNRTGSQGHTVRPLPLIPQPGKAEQAAVPAPNMHRRASAFFRVVGFPPFIEAVGRKQAAAAGQCRPKRRLFGERFRAGVDHAAADSGVARPGRHQSPLVKVQVPGFAGGNHRHGLRGRDVITAFHRRGDFGGKPLRYLLGVMVKGVSSAHSLLHRVGDYSDGNVRFVLISHSPSF